MRVISFLIWALLGIAPISLANPMFKHLQRQLGSTSTFQGSATKHLVQELPGAVGVLSLFDDKQRALGKTVSSFMRTDDDGLALYIQNGRISELIGRGLHHPQGKPVYVGVSLLDKNQSSTSEVFAYRTRRPERFEAVNGVPLLKDCHIRFVCQVTDIGNKQSDGKVVMATVLPESIEHKSGDDLLIHYQGKYHQGKPVRIFTPRSPVLKKAEQASMPPVRVQSVRGVGTSSSHIGSFDLDLLDEQPLQAVTQLRKRLQKAHDPNRRQQLENQINSVMLAHNFTLARAKPTDLKLRWPFPGEGPGVMTVAELTQHRYRQRYKKFQQIFETYRNHLDDAPKSENPELAQQAGRAFYDQWVQPFFEGVPLHNQIPLKLYLGKGTLRELVQDAPPSLFKGARIRLLPESKNVIDSHAVGTYAGLQLFHKNNRLLVGRSLYPGAPAVWADKINKPHFVSKRIMHALYKEKYGSFPLDPGIYGHRNPELPYYYVYPDFQTAGYTIPH